MNQTKERGLTMVELVIATAVTGLIVSFLGTSIYQMLTVTGYGNDRLTAMHELQNAAYWFSLDGQRAAAASADGGLSLTVSGGSSITYSLVGTELRRTAGGDGITPAEDITEVSLPIDDRRVGPEPRPTPVVNYMMLAKNITEASFSVDNRLITMSLTSSPEGRDDVSENGTYQVFLRPAGEAEQ